MPGRGRGRIRDSNQGGGGSGGASSSGGGKGSGGSGDAFGDYDEEEVAALEAYMKTHPSKEEDKEALRKRAKELSARIGSGQVSTRPVGPQQTTHHPRRMQAPHTRGRHLLGTQVVSAKSKICSRLFSLSLGRKRVDTLLASAIATPSLPRCQLPCAASQVGWSEAAGL